MGLDARIIPARFVKPYVKSNKTDTVDAAAIAEAVTRPTMRFVEVRTTSGKPRAKKRDPIPHHQSGTRGADLIKALPPKAAD
jgi:hypothetical protein